MSDFIWRLKKLCRKKQTKENRQLRKQRKTLISSAFFALSVCVVPLFLYITMVRVARFERAASCSQGKRPTPGLHPDILLFFLWFYGLFFAVFSVYGRSCGQGQKQRIGKGRFLRCFRRFLPLYSNGLDFRRSSQTTRATNCATPGYL